MSGRSHETTSEMPTAPATEHADVEIQVTPTCYRVSALPETDRAAPACTITVEYRATAHQWVICRFGECLSHDGTWHAEPYGSQRDTAWWTMHGHDLQTALDLARRVLPGLPACIHGLTVAQLVAQRAHGKSHSRAWYPSQQCPVSGPLLAAALTGDTDP